MTDTTNDTPQFNTDDVEANLAIEQGLGVGARELAAQRDAGGVVTADEHEDEDADQASDLDESLGVQGAEDDDQQLGSTSDA